MGKIEVNKIKVFAYHGCMPEETKIGTYFEVDVKIKTDFQEAAETDDLAKTVDYVQVREIVSREMLIPSKLIEHVGLRIKKAMLSEIRNISKVKVTIRKYNAPMGGEVDNVSIRV